MLPLVLLRNSRVISSIPTTCMTGTGCLMRDLLTAQTAIAVDVINTTISRTPPIIIPMSLSRKAVKKGIVI